MSTRLILIVFFVIMTMDAVFGFANLLVKDCEVKLEQDAEIMGSPVTLSTEREIHVIPVGDSESQAIKNGSRVVLEKQYIVKLSPKINQCMFEVIGGAHFDKGNSCTDFSSRSLCEGSRGAILTIDADSLGSELRISAGWSKSFQAGVSKTDFILYRKPETTEL